MKKRILRYFKHIALTILIPIPFVVMFGLYNGATLHYAHDPNTLNWNKEGPYVFYLNDSMVSVSYLEGHPDTGFYASKQVTLLDTLVSLQCFYPLDSSQFQIPISKRISSPPSVYEDRGRILAVSDFESNYRTFRDFLIKNNVINEELEWTFGNGHLVLVGDFVDRGYFTTQVLWFIYRLEQVARNSGGFVHFIIGNHELKMMHGDYNVTSPKYYHVASILEKKQVELYDRQSFIGRWMSSKNAIEMINGNLFVHGGLHPDFAEARLGLDTINDIIRKNYYHSFSTRSVKSTRHFVTSAITGPCWYRGYFREDLTQQQVENTLLAFDATSIVVGHTLQSKVKKSFQGKVYGIDVKHPIDGRTDFPAGRSEGLLIEDGVYYRVLDTGLRENL